MPSGLEGLIWGSTAGSIQCADGEKHGLFRSRCLFSCVMQQNASKITFSRVDDCHAGSNRATGNFETSLLTIPKDGEHGEAVRRYVNCCVQSKLEAGPNEVSVPSDHLHLEHFSEWTQQPRCVWL